MSYLVRKRNKREEGFTLIELVIVIAIIGILMAIAIPNYMRAREAAAASATQANLRNLATALELFMAENNLSTYPPVTGVAEDINAALDPYFDGPAPTPPAGGNYQYAPVTPTDGTTNSSFLIWDPNVYAGKGYSVGPGGNIIIEDASETYEPEESGVPINFGHD